MKDIVHITSNGNFLRHCDLGFYFQSQTGEFLRQVSHEEAVFLALNTWQATIEFLPEHPQFFPEWQSIHTICVRRDMSKYKSETSGNGGDYGFATYHDWFVAKYPNGEWKFAYIERQSTTAEFEFDEFRGEFQQGLNFLTILNANPRVSDYRTQTASRQDEYDVLEKLAEMSDFDTLWNWGVYEYIDEEEIHLFPAIEFSDKKYIIEKLRAIGVEKLSKSKNHRRTRAGGGGTRK